MNHKALAISHQPSAILRSGIPFALALLFLVLHLPYLPSSLEDVDSINFALGLRRFDVAHHQPHPPGYPLFIGAARLVNTVAHSEAKALAAVSVVSGALGVLAVVALFRRIGQGGPPSALSPLVGAALVMTAPLYWFTSARPLSDTMGLSAALGIQALILAARTPRAVAAAAFLAGVAVGIRSQVLWLTAPLLLWVLADRWTAARRTPVAPDMPQAALLALAAFTAGSLAWFIPLVVLSGGPTAYWRALFAQGAEDLSGIQMLWTTPTPRAFLAALYYAFIAPWAAWTLAGGVLVLAAAGVVWLGRRDRRALVLVTIAFGPYLVFDMLFQETFTSRYALPLVVPLAFFASAGLAALPPPLALAAAVPIVMYGAHIGGRSIADYARQPAPAFRLVADMRAALTASTMAVVLAPDRRQSFDLRRPLVWTAQSSPSRAAPAAPAFDRQLAAPPQHEWLEAVKYWNAGGRAPVWFVVDPRRAAIDLVQHDRPASYRWSVPYPVLLSGTRPNDADWYRVERPDWYVGDGWSLTPESAGVADADRRGLIAGPIDGWVRRDAAIGGAFVLAGRNFAPGARSRLTTTVDGIVIDEQEVAPGSFASVKRLPESLAVGSADYLRLTVTPDPPARVAVEQFDVAATRAVLAFERGWHEQELNPSTGVRWRWMSRRAEIRYITPEGGGTVLRISGESPLAYYARPSRLVIRSGDTVLRDTTVAADFTIEVPVLAAIQPAVLLIETDQAHVPAEGRWGRSADRRELGLRIYECALQRPAASADIPQRVR